MKDMTRREKAALDRHITASDDEVNAAIDDIESVYESRCPYCNEFMDYCLGHGEIGDPVGALVLKQHNNEDHSSCHDLAECRQ